MDLLRAYRQMYLIRGFEDRLPALYRRGLISGTGHLCSGQEAGTVAVGASLEDGDAVFSNHRGHGHFLAATGDADGLLRELAGRADGICGGRGGTQHLCVPGRFYSNGVLGGMVAPATGYAAALQLRGPGGVVVAFLGDGALGEGVVYESLNMAAVRELPVIYVVEDNGVSQSTPKARHMAGDIAARFAAFAIEVAVVESTELADVDTAVGEALAAARAGAGPRGLVLCAPRLTGHSVNSGSESDGRDSGADPLPRLRRHLAERDVELVERDVDAELAELFGAPWLRAGAR